ncbi:MAG TPA: hypothetical protein VEK07_05440 [Polyangiaceae bacterium]|nr:hypothetical protein [Polyangiaceae bacterium]
MDVRRQQTLDLRRQIEWTLARAVDPGDVLPMLHRLARLAGDGTEESAFANLHLAELLVERDPWRAALYARRVLASQDNDRGWATLALCQTMLGHYRFAVTAYQKALANAPDNPWYAHNLGHLLDVALDRPSDAVGWLKRASEGAAHSREVAASYAHALARVGRVADARKVLARAMKRGSSREYAALLQWLDEGAPPHNDHSLLRAAPVQTIAARGLRAGGDRGRAALASAGSSSASTGACSAGKRAGDVSALQSSLPRSPPSRAPTVAELDGVLARGMASLPLDAKQRTRAKVLARDAAGYFAPSKGSKGAGRSQRAAVDAIAAAVAYAIVYVDHVPLTQAEVAACFRVGVASLRGRFGELRAHLDLTPGDARYATLHRV